MRSNGRLVDAMAPVPSADVALVDALMRELLLPVVVVVAVAVVVSAVEEDVALAVDDEVTAICPRAADDAFRFEDGAVRVVDSEVTDSGRSTEAARPRAVSSAFCS